MRLCTEAQTAYRGGSVTVCWNQLYKMLSYISILSSPKPDRSAKKKKKNVNVAPDTSSQRVTVVKWECSDSLTPLACHLIILHVLTRICISNFRHLDRNLNRAEKRIMKTT